MSDLPLDHLRSLPDGKLSSREVAILCDEIDRLASLVEKLRPYLRHDEDCPALDCSDACLSIVEHACRCGLADLLAEIGDEK